MESEIIVCRAEVVLAVGCTVKVDVVLGTSAPGFVVGTVTMTCGVADVLLVELVVESSTGHRAATIPPLFTMPSSVLGFTVIVEQASCTSACIDSRF